MPTFDVLLSDTFVRRLGEAVWPKGWRVVGPADGPASFGTHRYRVEADDAPGWTEGQLVHPVFGMEPELDADNQPTGRLHAVAVDWRPEVDPATLEVGDAMRRAHENPGTVARGEQ